MAQDSFHRTIDNKPQGTFYILYDDVHAGKNLWMGAVSFRDITRAPFEKVYSHSLHGFRYSTDKDPRVEEVANRYVIKDLEKLEGIGFYTLGSEVNFSVSLHRQLDTAPLVSQKGRWKKPGFHYLELNDSDIQFHPGEEIYVALHLENSDYAYSASARLDVLLGSPLPERGKAVDVYSKAQQDEGFYRQLGQDTWFDFSNYVHPSNDQSKHHQASKNPTASLPINLYTSKIKLSDK